MQLPENPFLPAPSAASAWAEGFTKGFVAISSPQPGENVGAEDIDAFNQGVAAGEESARTGIETGDPCVAAAEGDPGHVPVMVWDGIETLHGGWEIIGGVGAGQAAETTAAAAAAAARVAAGIAGLVVVLIELAINLPKHTLPPDEVLPTLGQPVVDALASYGLTSMQLFCGAALDPTATDCEIRLTPLFTSQDLARQAAIAMNRSQWLVASWRTDQSNSFQIVDSG